MLIGDIKMNNLRVGFFCDKYVGEKTLEYMLSYYKAHIKCIALTDENSEIVKLINKYEFNKDYIFYNKDLYENTTIDKIKELNLDYIILAWWPKIIKEPILSIAKKGMINFHNSLLPYCRGKNPNFWSIVEGVPYGVTMHYVSEGIDEGDILFQKKIDVSWEDTGETIYNKSLDKMIELFIESYPELVKGEFEPLIQDLSAGSFHLSKELDISSQIFLEKEYKAKDLLNLLRARTFKPFPGCYFFENGRKYEVRVEITKVED